MSKKIIDIDQPPIKANKNMRDYSNEPAFIKAAERATEFLKKHPLPEEFLQPKGRKKENN